MGEQNIPRLKFPDGSGNIASDKLVQHLRTTKLKFPPTYLEELLKAAILRINRQKREEVDPDTLTSQARSFIMQAKDGVGIHIEPADESNAITFLTSSSTGGRRNK